MFVSYARAAGLLSLYSALPQKQYDIGKDCPTKGNIREEPFNYGLMKKEFGKLQKQMLAQEN